MSSMSSIPANRLRPSSKEIPQAAADSSAAAFFLRLRYAQAAKKRNIPFEAGASPPRAPPPLLRNFPRERASVGSDRRSSTPFRFAPCAGKSKRSHSRRGSLPPVAGDAVRRMRLARRDGIVCPVTVRGTVVTRRRALVVPGRHRRGFAPAAFVVFHLAFLLVRPVQRRPESARRSRSR